MNTNEICLPMPLNSRYQCSDLNFGAHEPMDHSGTLVQGEPTLELIAEGTDDSLECSWGSEPEEEPEVSFTLSKEVFMVAIFTSTAQWLLQHPRSTTEICEAFSDLAVFGDWRSQLSRDRVHALMTKAGFQETGEIDPVWSYQQICSSSPTKIPHLSTDELQAWIDWKNDPSDPCSEDLQAEHRERFEQALLEGSRLKEMLEFEDCF